MSRWTNNLWSKQAALNYFCWAALLLTGSLTALADQSVSLTWNPSPDTNAVGYRIYYGGASHAYTNSIMVGNVTNTIVNGLNAGTTYYFGATTLDVSGNESELSNETSYDIPALAATGSALAPVQTSVTQAQGSFAFVVSGTTGTQYVVQASSDLVHWTAVQTNTAPFTYVEANTASFPSRFYRTYSLQ